ILCSFQTFEINFYVRNRLSRTTVKKNGRNRYKTVVKVVPYKQFSVSFPDLESLSASGESYRFRFVSQCSCCCCNLD
ncbi:hypothetical protein M5D96_009462, partial [Drosophila gunungcola]